MTKEIRICKDDTTKERKLQSKKHFDEVTERIVKVIKVARKSVDLIEELKNVTDEEKDGLYQMIEKALEYNLDACFGSDKDFYRALGISELDWDFINE